MGLNEFSSSNDQSTSISDKKDSKIQSTRIHENNNSSSNDEDHVPYDLIVGAANFILNSTKYRPKIGIICGSGLGSFGECIENAETIQYKEIPNFPVSTVEGHRGQMTFGDIKGVPVMCMQGRFHYYEGYSLAKCCMPIRVMKIIGITHLIITNAAGSLNEKYNVGDIVVMKDHINFLGLAGVSPLRGANESRFGPRFLPTNNAYDDALVAHALHIADEMNMKDSVHQGVYVCVGGPTYESIAEARLLAAFGGDCAGMSTVHEVIAARHCDIKVVAFSFITNKCIADYACKEVPDHDEIMKAAMNQQCKFVDFIKRLVGHVETD